MITIIENKKIDKFEKIRQIKDKAVELYQSNNKAMNGVTIVLGEKRNEVLLLIETPINTSIHWIGSFPAVLKKEIETQSFRLYRKIK